jgi:sugar phosphate isomerase/epimerase
MRCAPILAGLGVALATAPGSLASDDPALGLPNPFFAMDTCTKNLTLQSDIPPSAQFDLLKETGYPGTAWTEESPDAVRAALRELETRGLTMYAIYCGATAKPDGSLAVSPQVAPILDVLKGKGTVIWLHMGGKGPAISALSGSEPIITELRWLADEAGARALKIAIYPHVGEWTERFSDALHVAELVDRPNFGVTFNLCHALATGSETEIPSLLERAGQKLFLVTINGADAGVSRPDWSRLIQTLDRGSYDVGAVLRTLHKLDYCGPIGLQGYGLGGDRRENLKRSRQAWERLSTAAATEKG